MSILTWIPQVQSYISIESTNRIKPRLLTALKSKCIYQQRKIIFKRMVWYFRILEPNASNIVNQYKYHKGITETNLPFWYNVNDNEFRLKVTPQSCKFCVGFEKVVENNFWCWI